MQIKKNTICSTCTTRSGMRVRVTRLVGVLSGNIVVDDVIPREDDDGGARGSPHRLQNRYLRLSRLQLDLRL